MEQKEFNERYIKLMKSINSLKMKEEHGLIWSTVLTDILIYLILEQPEPNASANLVIERIKEKANFKKTP